MDAIKIMTQDNLRKEPHQFEIGDTVRVHCRIKEGERCDLLDRLAADPAFPLGEAEIRQALDPAAFIGRCPQQVTAFLAGCAPLLAGETAEMQSVKV